MFWLAGRCCRSIYPNCDHESQALALELATDGDRLHAIRRKLEANRLTYPLFDTNRLCLEVAYTTMWEMYERGEPPRSFAVDPVEAWPS